MPRRRDGRSATVLAVVQGSPVPNRMPPVEFGGRRRRALVETVVENRRPPEDEPCSVRWLASVSINRRCPLRYDRRVEAHRRIRKLLGRVPRRDRPILALEQKVDQLTEVCLAQNHLVHEMYRLLTLSNFAEISECMDGLAVSHAESTAYFQRSIAQLEGLIAPQHRDVVAFEQDASND
jgi:hypothetical protein